jgi:hypothetical protein
MERSESVGGRSNTVDLWPRSVLSILHAGDTGPHGRISNLKYQWSKTNNRKQHLYCMRQRKKLNYRNLFLASFPSSLYCRGQSRTDGRILNLKYISDQKPTEHNTCTVIYAMEKKN